MEAASRGHLLVVPQAQAGEFRRAMFFLCTLALMGTEDQLMQAKGKGEVWARLGWWGRLDLQVTTGCRARVFLLNVLYGRACMCFGHEIEMSSSVTHSQALSSP